MGKPGRPPIIETPEEFDRLVDEYVVQCAEKEEPLTITGLALHLGIYGRRALYEQAERDGFSPSVRRAQSIVEADYEKRLVKPGIAAGTIFALKNFGWADKQEHEFSGPGGAPIETEIRVIHEVIDPKA